MGKRENTISDKPKGQEIIGTAPGRRKPSSFGSSLNRFADECPLSGGKADIDWERTQRRNFAGHRW
jgi:hypothetical protein